MCAHSHLLPYRHALSPNASPVDFSPRLPSPSFPCVSAKHAFTRKSQSCPFSRAETIYSITVEQRFRGAFTVREAQSSRRYSPTPKFSTLPPSRHPRPFSFLKHNSPSSNTRRCRERQTPRGTIPKTTRIDSFNNTNTDMCVARVFPPSTELP